MKNNIPIGYDAICEWCESAYAYSNARGLNVKKWKHYCSKLCEEHDEQYVTDTLRRSNRNVTAHLLEKQSHLTPDAPDGVVGTCPVCGFTGTIEEHGQHVSNSPRR